MCDRLSLHVFHHFLNSLAQFSQLAERVAPFLLEVLSLLGAVGIQTTPATYAASRIIGDSLQVFTRNGVHRFRHIKFMKGVAESQVVNPQNAVERHRWVQNGTLRVINVAAVFSWDFGRHRELTAGNVLEGAV